MRLKLMKTRSAGGRLSAALLSLGLISWGLVSCTMAEAWADPFLPRDDGMVLEHLPGATDRSATRVRGLRRLLARAVPDPPRRPRNRHRRAFATRTRRAINNERDRLRRSRRSDNATQ